MLRLSSSLSAKCSLQLPDAYNHYTLHVHDLHFERLDTGNCSGLHIYTAESIGCHKSSWQSLGRHIYTEDASPSAPQMHTNILLYWFLIGITSDFASLIGHRSWVCGRPSRPVAHRPGGASKESTAGARRLYVIVLPPA